MARGVPVAVEYEGGQVTIPDLARRCGVAARTLHSRIFQQGWTVARAATAPVDRRKRSGGRATGAAPRPVPKLKRRADGGAYCRWKAAGQQSERRFGKYGSPECRADYQKFATDWIAGRYDPSPDAPATGGASVTALGGRFMDHVESYYLKDGKPTSEVQQCRAAAKVAYQLYGDRPASEFDPAALRACRDVWVARSLTRHTCNVYTSRLVRMFRWGGANSVVGPEVYAALKLVEPLRAGRTTAPDRERKRPATEAQVAATIPFLCPADPARAARVGAMIRVQRLTGMRPGEVCAMRPADIDTAADVWRYTVGGANKNRHRGKRQVYYLGPKAVAELRPHIERVTADQPVFGETADTYLSAVMHASVKAGVRWAPHQLRHALATAVAEQFRTLEHAAAAIGDTEAVAQAVYVHLDPRERAKIEVARAMG